MFKFTHPGRMLIGLLLIFALALTGCGSDDAAQPSATPPSVTVALAAPAGPEGQYLTVTLVDADGAAITDATVGLEGNMNHAGMVPVLADAVTENADGVYRIPFAFTMRGDWIVTISVTLADGTSFTQDVDLTVTADEVEVQAK